jgi:DNA repair protein RadC
MNPHQGHRQRVRQRFINEGLSGFEDHQVLELLLFYCIPMKDTNLLAHKLIDTFSSLSNLLEAHPLEIMKRCDINENTAVLISMIPALSKKYLQSRWNKKTRLDSPQSAGAYLINLFMGQTNEAFYILCLDIQRRLNSSSLVNEGTINEAPVYIREIVQTALLHKASCVILSHNHPGGVLYPSGADIEATRAIIRVFEYMDITVLDHIIIAEGKYFSFAENHLLKLKF